MNILFLISQLPYSPDTGAKIRGFNILKNMSRKHSITLITFGDRDKEAEKIRAIQSFCKEIILVSKKKNSLAIGLMNLFSIYPYSSDKYYSKEMVKTIGSILKNGRFDLIHADSAQVSRNVLKIKGVPKVLTEHNIEFQIFLRAARSCGNPVKKAYFYLQYLKLKWYEIYAVRQFDHVITVSEEDRRFLLNFVPGEKVSVAPNGVDTKYFSPRSTVHGPRPEDAIIFTGSMDWLPNIEAVKYFCKDILPLIWQVKKDIKFYIVGRNAPKNIIGLGKKDARIVVTGSVEDVRPYIEKAKAFIVPLRIGGGTRLKILEAMAMKKAVVSTSIGCEGLAVKNMEDIAIADSPSEFAEVVKRLIEDENLRDRLGAAGRQLTERKYDWNIVADKLDTAWNEAAKIHDLPIVLYHDICEDGFDINKADPEKKPYIINKSEFIRQMQYLHENGYKTISLNNFFSVRPYEGKKRKAVIILFDDGLESNYSRAFPVLKEYGLKAAFFITTGRVGQNDMMTWEQIRKLHETGMEIGSHSISHSIPARLAESELEYELVESKKILEKNLGMHIDYFSSPTGFHDPRIPPMAERAGYKAVILSKASLNKAGNGFVLYKASVKRNYSFERFIAMVSGDITTFNSLLTEQKTRNGLKRILGPDVYDRIRSAILGSAK